MSASGSAAPPTRDSLSFGCDLKGTDDRQAADAIKDVTLDDERYRGLSPNRIRTSYFDLNRLWKHGDILPAVGRNNAVRDVGFNGRPHPEPFPLIFQRDFFDE